MPTIVADLMGRFDQVTQDLGSVRWTTQVRVDWLNEAYRVATVLRPDVTATTAVVTLAAGHRQRLQDAASVNLPTAYLMLDCIANAGPKKGRIQRGSQAVLDSVLPNWRDTPPSTKIDLWLFEDRNPREFLVYPPALAGVQVELLYSAMPAAHAIQENMTSILAESIKIHEAYAPALLDYLLYRAYLMDTDSQANLLRSQMHYQAFTQGITGKTQADQASSPNVAST